MNELTIKNLSASVSNKKVLDDINLTLKKGEVCVLMGPNGAGKSTISNILLGNDKYKITNGTITLDGIDITNESTDKRAKLGLFMCFQNPIEISGVTYINFLRQSYNLIKETNIQLKDFITLLEAKMENLGLDKKFKSRFVNKGFSGGEKKRFEMLQLLLLEPKYAIFDEIDSGLDVDGLKIICDQINNIKKEKKTGILIITHYNKILEYINPDKVILLKEGKIKKTGDINLAKSILENGFENIG